MTSGCRSGTCEGKRFTAVRVASQGSTLADLRRDNVRPWPPSPRRSRLTSTASSRPCAPPPRVGCGRACRDLFTPGRTPGGHWPGSSRSPRKASRTPISRRCRSGANCPSFLILRWATRCGCLPTISSRTCRVRPTRCGRRVVERRARSSFAMSPAQWLRLPDSSESCDCRR